jgi:hypothetical protein
MTLTLAWWQAPTAITLAGLIWALLWPVRADDWAGDILRLIRLVIALALVAGAWALAGAAK